MLKHKHLSIKTRSSKFAAFVVFVPKKPEKREKICANLPHRGAGYLYLWVVDSVKIFFFCYQQVLRKELSPWNVDSKLWRHKIMYKTLTLFSFYRTLYHHQSYGYHKCKIECLR